VHALVARGPSGASALVPLDLAGTEYNESDNWVVRYEGPAEVVELGIDVLKYPYIVAAVGANVVPIVTPPVFDQLLSPELESIACLTAGKRGRSNVKRQAKKLFSAFRSLPILDSSLQAVAKLSKDNRSNPAPAIVRVAQGFLSSEAAKSIGEAFLHILDKVSPPNSRAAWAVVALFPVVGAFFATADSFTSFSLPDPWSALLPLAYALIASALAMLVVSPIGWLLSAVASYLMRLKVPSEYRQRARNWTPLKGACMFSVAASLVGAMYGTAGAMHWVPTIRETAKPVVTYAIAHTESGTDAYRYLARLVSYQTVLAPVGAMTDADTTLEIQRYLVAHGYLRGQADGKVGPRTSAAISRYERQEQLDLATPPVELLAHMMQR